MMIRRVLAAFVLSCIAACGSSSPSTPPVTTPSVAPTPVPTPTPNPYIAQCGTPLPDLKDLYGFKVKVQLEPSKTKKVLNASPLVNNKAYCVAAGLPGNFCSTRNEEMAERVPCDYYISGQSDQGRPGPNWFQRINGVNVKCGVGDKPGEAPGCALKPENQFLLDVNQGGVYVACGGTGSNGSCGVCILDDSTFGKIHGSPAGLCQNE
jgi:hypothetical protein